MPHDLGDLASSQGRRASPLVSLSFGSPDQASPLIMDCVSRAFIWLSARIFGANDPPQAPTPGDMGQQNPPQGGSRKISFNVSDQYEIQDVIGEGAYGVVW